MSERKNRLSVYICILILLAEAVLLFVANKSIAFILDDNWYATNLVTGDKLSSFSDIIESQIWHFNNWGGRCVTHGILQMVIMSGELVADILNTAMVFLLAYMIILVADSKNLISYTLTVVMITALNANAGSSMFWQSGSVNYLYSSTWILLFIFPYVCYLRSGKSVGAINILWMLPIGIMAGWSNENVGPAVFCFTLMAMFYLHFHKKEKLSAWMIIGSLASLFGSILVIIAPGNFVRNSEIERVSLIDTILERLVQMLRAGADYLLPSFVLLTLIALLYICFEKGKIEAVGVMLIITMILSFGAMILSPHYPDRATFGTMIFAIAEIISIGKRTSEKEEYGKAFWAIMVLLLCMSVLSILKGGGMFGEY